MKMPQSDQTTYLDDDVTESLESIGVKLSEKDQKMLDELTQRK